MENILNVIKDPALDYKQKKNKLACEAENLLPYVNISKKSKMYLENGVLCDIFEGHAPYRPRYILPDYLKYFQNGSEFLNIDPPTDMYEAVNALLIIYSYVPSITGFPVYLGQIDDLLEPFVNTVSDNELENLLKLFLINIDRTLSNAFVHMNIGPKDSKVGRTILRLEKELKKAVPNLSLKFSEETSFQLAKLAVETALETGKPYFVNHGEIIKDLGIDYGIASCYNSLKIGGGSHTLVRLNLKEAAKLSKNYDDFIENVLKDAVEAQCEIINSRAKFIVEEAEFFKNSFLSKEGLINLDNFTSMAGVFGLFECVEILNNGGKIGSNNTVNEIVEKIIEKTQQYINSWEGAYCKGTYNKIGFHAQSGIDSDVDVSAGVRIRIGEEPNIFDQIKVEGKLQKYFNTGVSDIYIFDDTSKKNIEGILTIIKGAFKNGMKIFALNNSNSDLIRITGYLVKKSDYIKYNDNIQYREDTVKLGAESILKQNTLNRKVRTKDEGLHQ